MAEAPDGTVTGHGTPKLPAVVGLDEFQCAPFTCARPAELEGEEEHFYVEGEVVGGVLTLTQVQIPAALFLCRAIECLVAIRCTIRASEGLGMTEPR